MQHRQILQLCVQIELRKMHIRSVQPSWTQSVSMLRGYTGATTNSKEFKLTIWRR